MASSIRIRPGAGPARIQAGDLSGQDSRPGSGQRQAGSGKPLLVLHSLDDIRLLVEVKAEGELLASQQIWLEGIAPGATTELQLELPSLDGRETFVQLRVIKATATRYSAAEHELGQYQFRLKSRLASCSPLPIPTLPVGYR